MDFWEKILNTEPQTNNRNKRNIIQVAKELPPPTQKKSQLFPGKNSYSLKKNKVP
jgi:hypothetical protein